MGYYNLIEADIALNKPPLNGTVIMNSPRIIKNIPAGTYYVGDPCYVFNNSGKADSWMKIIEISDCFDIPHIEFKDKPVIAFGTSDESHFVKFGDGVYNGFCVDSGLIGIVDISLIEEGSAFFNESFDRDKHTVTFDKPFDFEWDNGDFHNEVQLAAIGGRISIYTNDEEEYDDHYEYDDE